MKAIGRKEAARQKEGEAGRESRKLSWASLVNSIGKKNDRTLTRLRENKEVQNAITCQTLATAL